jgi:C4-dicarboxylate-specific signal transduction histidine kinase
MHTFQTSQLSKSEARTHSNNQWSYEEVLQNIDIGIIIVDAVSRTIHYQNPTALRLLSNNDTAIDFQDLPEQLLELQTEHVDSGISHTMNRNGRLLGFSSYPTSGQHDCLLVRDITEKRRLESIAQAVNTMDNIGFIFAGIRHEIGNPLNSIKMTISVLQKNLDDFSKTTVGTYLERASSEITRMEYLLKSLKNFSMFEKQDIRAHDLFTFINKLQALVSCDFEQKGIRLQIEPAPERICAFFDPRALHQVLLNLLSNAVDALHNRSNPEIRISTATSGDLCWLTVKDNGCGINDEQRKLLFQPFCTSKAHGNGLGLVITRKLLAKMNASIDIRSTADEGTIVQIALPLAKERVES